MSILNVLHLMRFHQYIKNFFIFIPAFFSFKFFDENSICNSLIAFVAFCLCASAIYIINDIIDAPSDRIHPSKSKRPIASGKIKPKVALFFAMIFLVLSIFILIYLLPEVIFPVVVYVVINLLYTLKLKHVPIVDIFIIASGFVIRLFVGALAVNVPLSEWIIVMTFLLALFLALAKRRDDVILYESSGEKMRKVVDGYNLQFLDIAMAISGSIVMIAYILWSISAEVKLRLHSDYLYLTSIFVLAGIFRYMQIAFVEKKSGNPSKIVLQDRFLQGVILCWLVSFWILMYMRG
ncbi:decaprenyl-phosphate phosphoribosyltransferase [Helicobacter cappadocius]|uniref:Decaprenyl-phosphate phosphoribosyltransferase n=1 Tax=Helicobacter cappadocius TaxID=3063998 RepID=A0AA90TC48_9HELI|nr:MULTISPECIES: decaprenyl-phosphate phosphoribosyltransferase [unclassified Helicobacter]MDO7253539.1 decaprenyl-phosphate phosphoribosyltransferase [Helicobacter sp. faydin-H75]MDP2539466.1 decaprenyl-phosphate phosphoribosyltransferase [Helicobacter sp. faydin-H76]